MIPPSKKSMIFHKIFDGNIEDITLSLIDLVVTNGRESFLPAIARVFIHDTLKYKGITESMLTTAVRIDEKIKKQISDLISDIFKTRVDLHTIVEPGIVGGFILQVDDNYIDASIRNKLRRVKKELLGSSAVSQF